MQGLGLALSAYIIWGCFPLFFSFLVAAHPLEVLAHRVIWSLIITLLLGWFYKRLPKLWQVLKQKENLLWLGLSSWLIAANWLLFIWAVGQERAMEASLGYFLTPLISLILASLLLKEAINRWQIAAGCLAALGIGWELISLGQFPWLPLSLALTFGFYGLIRKRLQVEALEGLTTEALLLLPLALGWLLLAKITGLPLMFTNSTQLSLLLIAGGLVTALPLLLFAAATKQLDLSLVGFIMYINPTIQFLLALFVLQESFPPQRIFTFIFIWLAMLIFMWGIYQAKQTAKSV